MTLTVPKRAVPYILFQRTEYLKNRSFFNFLSKIGKYKPLHNSSVYLKSLFFSKEIINSFVLDINRDFDSVKSFLPEHATSVLDIGAGMAAVNAIVSDYYKHNLQISLLDKNKLEKHIYYDYNPKTAYYNSFDLSTVLLKSNGVSEKNIHCYEVGDSSVFNNKYDIISSYYSWGFHYPVATYLDEVYDSLTETGVLIIDISKKSNGKKELEAKFREVTLIEDQPAALRLCCRK